MYITTVWKQSLFRRLGIPGPFPFPLLGMLKDFAKKGVGKADQELVEKYGDIVGVYMGSLPSMLITDTDMIKEIFIKEYQTFTNRVALVKPEGVIADMITVVEDDHWKFIRSTMTPTFTTGKLKNMLKMIQRCCDDFVEKIAKQSESGKSIDMKEICGCYTMDVISSTAFGLQINSQKEQDNEFIKYIKKSITNKVLKPYFVIVFVAFPTSQPVRDMINGG